MRFALKRLVAAASLCAVVVILTIAYSHSTTVHGQILKGVVSPVLVTNAGEAQAVPITGATTVSGTVAATQSGAWTVAVSGTPAVQAGDNNARNALTAFNSAVMGGGVALQLVTVPAAKRLVIEQVSVSHTLPTAATSSIALSGGLETTSGGITTVYAFTGGFAGVVSEPGFTLNQFVASSQMRSYADAGTAVSVTVHSSQSGYLGLVNVSLSGYLVDMP